MTEDNDKTNNEHYSKYKGMGLKDLGLAFVDLKQRLETAKNAVTIIQKEFDYLRIEVIPEVMDDMGIGSANFPEIGRLGTAADAWVSIAAGKKVDAYKWLEDNGYEDLIQNTVNASTLKAFLKDLYKRGIEFPEELFSFKPYTRASVTKT